MTSAGSKNSLAIEGATGQHLEYMSVGGTADASGLNLLMGLGQLSIYFVIPIWFLVICKEV